MMKMLQRGTTWRNLGDLKDVNVHYQTVYKRFKKLGRKGIMKSMWDRLLETYSEVMMAIDSKHFGAIFLDSSMIYNALGVETTGKNHYDRNRLGTKVSAIVDKNKVPPPQQCFFKAEYIYIYMKIAIPSMF
jgi:hypothetical protein